MAPSSASRAAAARRAAPPRGGWPAARRLATLAFFALVLWLLVSSARRIEWGAVLDAVGRIGAAHLALAALLAAASHAVYASYDMMGRRYAGHALHARQVVGVTFVSYAFNLNFGTLVGGFAFRWRLYSRLGLGAAVITRVIAFSVTTNWIGYLALGGLLFALQPPELPPAWRLDSGGLRWLGLAMLALLGAYLGLCGFARKRSLSARGHAFALPSGRLALLQVAVSALNWALIGGIVWLLLQRELPYATVLATLLVAAVAGVLAHVPAGLGVLEAVFVALLSHRMPDVQLIAALLSYRAIYYLAPLALALPLYLAMEARARRLRQRSEAAEPPRHM